MDAIVPTPPNTLKIGTFNIGTRLIGQPITGDVWNDHPLVLPQDTADVSVERNASVPGTDPYVDNPLLLVSDTPGLSFGASAVLPIEVDNAILSLVADTPDLKLGVTLRLPVDQNFPLELSTSTADVHFGITLVTVDTSSALLLDGSPVRINPKLVPEDCTDLELVAAACAELDLDVLTVGTQTLVISGRTDLILVPVVAGETDLDPLDCVEA